MRKYSTCMSEEAEELLTRLSLLGRLFMCPTCALKRMELLIANERALQR